jgi:hypothetical protein
MWERELGFGFGVGAGVFMYALKNGNCVDLVQTIIGRVYPHSHNSDFIAVSCEVTTKL